MQNVTEGCIVAPFKQKTRESRVKQERNEARTAGLSSSGPCVPASRPKIINGASSGSPYLSMVPDSVLKSVVTAASYRGTSIPFRRVLNLHSLGRLAWQIRSKESHVEKTKGQDK